MDLCVAAAGGRLCRLNLKVHPAVAFLCELPVAHRFYEQAALMQRLQGIATAAGVQELAKELRDGGTLRRLAVAWTAAPPSAGQQAPLPAAAGADFQPEAPAGNLLAALEAAAAEEL